MTTSKPTLAQPSPRPAAISPTHETAPGESGPPALPCDLATLSDDVLAALALEAGREQERRKTRKEAEFFDFVREHALALGVTPARLAATIAGKSGARKRSNGGTDGRSNVKPKYWNPSDHAQRWAGRGARPPWFVEHIAAGGTEEDLRIPEGAV